MPVHTMVREYGRQVQRGLPPGEFGSRGYLRLRMISTIFTACGPSSLAS